MITRDHSLNSQIILIMNNFNFSLVHEIFLFCQYTYMDDIYNESVPNMQDIKDMALDLLRDVAERGELINQDVAFSSGRFEASYNALQETLSLKFVPEEKSIEHDEGNETIFVA
jgi:hypothetical protein